MTREPIKKSAQEKRKKIIECGFLLMCEKGYHNVSCIDIAKVSNVSTGIIYQYFNNKRDIFIEGIKKYSNDIMFPVIEELDNIDKRSIKDIVNSILDKFIESHKGVEKAHEEIMAMCCLDSEIASIYHNEEINTTRKIADNLASKYNISNINEKIHLIYGMLDNYCHEVIYHKHSILDYEVMKEILVDTVVDIIVE